MTRLSVCVQSGQVLKAPVDKLRDSDLLLRPMEATEEL